MTIRCSRDAAFARDTRHGGVIAPPTLVCETNQIFQNPPDGNGYIGHNWPLPLPSNRFIRGGNEYEFHQPVRADDRITVTVAPRRHLSSARPAAPGC